MGIYSFMERSPKGVKMNGFSLLGDQFTLLIASDARRLYLDGNIHEDSFGAILLTLTEEDGIRYCKDVILSLCLEEFGLYDWPFFVLTERLYAASYYPLLT